jgi:hypothetical protein
LKFNIMREGKELGLPIIRNLTDNRTNMLGRHRGKYASMVHWGKHI